MGAVHAQGLWGPEGSGPAPAGESPSYPAMGSRALRRAVSSVRRRRPGFRNEDTLPPSVPSLKGLAAVTEGDRLAHDRTERAGIDTTCELGERQPVRLDNEVDDALTGLDDRHHTVGEAGTDNLIKQVATDEVKDKVDVTSVLQPPAAVDVHELLRPEVSGGSGLLGVAGVQALAREPPLAARIGELLSALGLGSHLSRMSLHIERMREGRRGYG